MGNELEAEIERTISTSLKETAEIIDRAAKIGSKEDIIQKVDNIFASKVDSLMWGSIRKAMKDRVANRMSLEQMDNEVKKLNPNWHAEYWDYGLTVWLNDSVTRNNDNKNYTRGKFIIVRVVNGCRDSESTSPMVHAYMLSALGEALNKRVDAGLTDVCYREALENGRSLSIKVEILIGSELAEESSVVYGRATHISTEFVEELIDTTRKIPLTHIINGNIRDTINEMVDSLIHRYMFSGKRSDAELRRFELFRKMMCNAQERSADYGTSDKRTDTGEGLQYSERNVKQSKDYRRLGRVSR